MSIATHPLHHEEQRSYLEDLLFQYRIEAELRVFPLYTVEETPPGKHWDLLAELITQTSFNTCVVLLPLLFPPQTEDLYDSWLEKMHIMTKDLPATLLIHATTNIMTTEM
jgi:hypothetical protein